MTGEQPGPRTAPPLDALVFDFDGVLAETGDIKTRAFIELYRDYGPAVVERVVAHHRAHGGVSRIRKIRHYHRELLGLAIGDEELAALAQRFSDLVVDAVVASEWVSGARAVLDANLGRLPMFVVSGTPEAELRAIVARRGMAHYFVAVRGSPPDKVSVIREILDAHGFEPARVLFVGDALTDHDAARSTGLRFLGRVGPAGPNPFPDGTHVIPDLTHLAL